MHKTISNVHFLSERDIVYSKQLFLIGITLFLYALIIFASWVLSNSTLFLASVHPLLFYYYVTMILSFGISGIYLFKLGLFLDLIPSWGDY